MIQKAMIAAPVIKVLERTSRRSVSRLAVRIGDSLIAGATVLMSVLLDP
jgi:hypothetical protein